MSCQMYVNVLILSLKTTITTKPSKKLHVGQIWLECSFGSDRTWAARTVRETSRSPGSVTASQHTRYTVIRQNWAAPLTAAR
ncbi:hypothetical protein T08_16487 [Trichinella sp. T8]|nr:hypothetical protein T08_16487 [Trichinella sp. T8]